MADKTKLKWRCSYETLKYDTPDGDLSEDEYAVHPNGEDHIVRIEPKERWNTRKFEIGTVDISKKKLVQVIPGEKVVYDEFFLPDGKILRVLGNKDDYQKRATIPDYVQPVKELTQEEIERWQ